MKTIPTNKRINPARLHEALAAAGLHVATVRGGDAPEVVVDDEDSAAAVQAIIAAHDPDSDPERSRVAAALAILEDTKKTTAQRLNAVCEVVARMLRERLIP